MEGMAPHIHVGDGLLDLRHVARDALTTFASNLMMGMLLDGRCARAVWRIWAMTIQT